MIDAKNPRTSVNSEGRTGGTQYDATFRVDTTFNTGDFIPLYVKQCVPNERIRCDLNILARTTSPPLRPWQDFCYLDVYAFINTNYNLMTPTEYGGVIPTPLRVTWTRIMGENKDGTFVMKDGASNIDRIPTIFIDNNINNPTADTIRNTPVSNYFGFNSTYVAPGGTGRYGSYSNPFPWLMYGSVWNEFVRDWNYQPEVRYLDLLWSQMQGHRLTIGGGTNRNDDGTLNVIVGGSANTINQLLPVNRKVDYFSRALPFPQRFSGILTGAHAGLPVVPTYSLQEWQNQVWTSNPNSSVMPNLRENRMTGFTNRQLTPRPTGVIGTNELTSDYMATYINTTFLDSLELAYALYNVYEINASNHLYRDIIEAHFGVAPSNTTLNRPQMIGSYQQILTATQVENVGEQQDLGELGAYVKHTGGTQHFVDYTCDDYSVFMICVCIRPHRSYQSNHHAQWLKFTSDDYWLPLKNNLPYRPIYINEVVGVLPVDNNGLGYNQDPRNQDSVWAYRPSWDEHFYFPDLKTGQFLSTVQGTLDNWHFATKAEDMDNISASWLKETPQTIARTLAIPDWTILHQWQFEALIKLKGYTPITKHTHKVGRKI